jgi:hypothetical protein
MTMKAELRSQPLPLLVSPEMAAKTSTSRKLA